MCNATSTYHWKVSFLLPGLSSSSSSLLAYFVSGSFFFWSGPQVNSYEWHHLDMTLRNPAFDGVSRSIQDG